MTLSGKISASPLSPILPEMTPWTAEQLRNVTLARANVAPPIADGDFAPVDAKLCVWDAWPILTRAGDLARPGLWMALGSPWFPDPDERHGHARIHLLERTTGGWRCSGPAMPDGFSPGSREWSGSAIIEADGETLTLYFTAAGRRGESIPSFEQRLFQACATLRSGAQGWHLADWRGLTESVRRDPRFYMAPDAGAGSIGTIKAFRDPSYFHDMESGRDYLFFTASLAGSTSAFNGAVGAAIARDPAATQWDTLPPILGADGLNNELERPHVVRHQGLYYLFWSTQSHVFDPDGPKGPTGLYGMVSSELTSGWRPLNGTGLVIANPPEAPRQAYSWYVLPDLTVTSFVDDWGRGPYAEGAKRFGGSFAPFLRLALEGDASRLLAAG